MGCPADAVPTVAGSHMTLFRPTPPRIPGDRGSSTPGEVSKVHTRICWRMLIITRNANNVERAMTWQTSWFASRAIMAITCTALTLQWPASPTLTGTVRDVLLAMANSASKKGASTR